MNFSYAKALAPHSRGAGFVGDLVMKKTFLIPKLAFALILTVGALLSPAASARPYPPYACPDVYSPVICSDGHVYSNSCYASLAGAKDCVPYNDAV